VRQLRLAEISTDRVGWGTAFTDLDLDGRPDLVVANGSTLERDDDPGRLQAQRPFVLWNDGRRFHDVTESWGEDLERARVARGLACADHDGDGDPDFAVSVNRGSALLFVNEGPPGGHWVEIQWRGSAAAGLGATVAVDAHGRHQRRWLGADVSFASQHEGSLRFGVGDATTATLEVTLPGGPGWRFSGLPVDSRILVHGSPGRSSRRVPRGESSEGSIGRSIAEVASGTPVAEHESGG
ncbi:MAG: CRTAC1 family protein, partial [Thermoanaerobaculia bacterium]|nr:CRTAC1 family protein [Thermoanaerobaculia bacterium]